MFPLPSQQDEESQYGGPTSKAEGQYSHSADSTGDPRQDIPSSFARLILAHAVTSATRLLENN